jgi:Na+-driven multidrug efflux pump
VRSTGAVWAPLAIMIFSMVGVRVPFASILSPRWGADAIWWSFPLGTVTSAFLTSLYYRYGGWRRAHMLDHPIAEDDRDLLADQAVEVAV